MGGGGIDLLAADFSSRDAIEIRGCSDEARGDAPAAAANKAPSQEDGGDLRLRIKLSQPTVDGQPAVDVTQLPKTIDRKMEELDTDHTLRPTIINLGETWRKKHFASLLSGPERTRLGEEAQKVEKDKAFDLLDALSRSGALPIETASLHVVVAATHNFDLTLMDTVIQRNVNPIDKVERSMLIMASALHRVNTATMLEDNEVGRIQDSSPQLFQVEEAQTLPEGGTRS
mmetsp:Transcript_28816/g.62232  ORF Transcript_28816/g.62232 Transcript_28816/m.62232 type:complete len:229 (+) Transcript_28816:2-688(+)